MPGSSAETTPESSAEITPESTAETTPESSAETTPESETIPELSGETTQVSSAETTPNSLCCNIGSMTCTFRGTTFSTIREDSGTFKTCGEKSVSPEAEAEGRPEPTVAEIIAPPVLLTFLGALVILSLYLYTHKQHVCRRSKKPVSKKHRLADFDDLHSFTTLYLEEEESWNFMTERDEFALEGLKTFQNNGRGLMRIIYPPLLSLLFCPLTLFLYTPIVNLFWPKTEWSTPPNVNDAISCFLTPAGMVYAITFGFAFQEVSEKHGAVDNKIQTEISVCRKLMSLLTNLSSSTPMSSLKVIHKLKTELINKILYFQEFDDLIVRVDQWEILRFLQEECKTSHTALDRAIYTEVTRCVRVLDELASDCSIFRSHMHVFHWAFLEMLGYISFLGVLLIQAKSYKMELTLCFVTVVSISLLCYAISDMDSPFHGFFTVDLTIYSELIEHFHSCAGKYIRQIKVNNQES